MLSRAFAALASGPADRRPGRAVPEAHAVRGERRPAAASARPAMPAMSGAQPVRRRHRRALFAIGLLMMPILGMSALPGAALAATPAGTPIHNTAQASWQVNAAAFTAPSNTVTDIVAAPASAGVAAAFNPDIVRAGTGTQAIFTVTNTGPRAINNGVLTITPPPGVTIAPADPYTVLPNGDIRIALPAPVPVGGAITLNAQVQVPPTTPSGTLNMPVTLTAPAMPPVSGVAPLTVRNIRTPSTTTFMQTDPATGRLVPVNTYHAGQTVHVQVRDLDQNLDPYAAETVTATLTDPYTGDSETLVLTETGPNTGVFVAAIPSTVAAATPNDGIISVAANSQLIAHYTDRFDGTDSTSASAIVDPFGLVFDSRTGQPVNGATITLIDAATGRPATVFGDDGVSAFPATITSGGTATDASGKVYTFGPGQYRFPFVAPGTYRLKVTPPAGWNFPTQRTDAQIQLIPGAPFALTVGSRGETFTVNPGPALHIDLPLDASPVGIFLQKTAGKPKAAVGDFVPFTVTAEVPPAAPGAVSAVTFVDTLPRGFRFEKGSARLDGAAIPDPAISANGRTLTFTNLIPNFATGTKHTLEYLTFITPAARTGLAVNTVSASGLRAGAAVGSNPAKASLDIVRDLFTGKGYIIGRVFVDGGWRAGGKAAPGDGNGFNDKGEEGVAGVRVFLEDGRSVTTDKQGFYHFEGVAPGAHAVQVDLDSLHAQYEIAPLPNDRFAGRAFSQFVEVRGGGIWRANFRLIRRAPPAAKVAVDHTLAVKDGKVWANVVVRHDGKVALSKLEAVYLLPAGWKYIAGTATVDGRPVEPKRDLTGLIWPLDPAGARHVIRLAMRGDGKSGEKQAVAYARFASRGTPNGRTGMAINKIRDAINEERLAKSVDLHLNFDTRKADLKPEMLDRLERLVAELKRLEISRIEVIGHTDSRRIRPDHRKRFQNNQQLSEARAQTVADYLMKALGLRADQVSVKGMGARKPIASNRTAKGRAMNRRTEVNVFAQKVRRVLDTTIQSSHADATAKANGAWESDEPAPATPVSAAPAPGDVKAWLARQSDPSPALLFPTANDLPSIAATHVLVRHAPGQKATLKVNGAPADPFAFEGAKKNAAGTIAISHWRNVHLKDGENRLAIDIRDANGKLVKHLEQTVVFSGAPATAEWARKASDAIADGKRQPVIAVRLLDRAGHPARAGMRGEFSVAPPYHPADEPVDPARLESWRASYVVGENGIARIALKPTTRAGEVTLRFRLADGPQEVRAWIKPAARDWIMVGFGEGTLGYNKLKGAIQPINRQSEKDGYYRDGRLAFYAKGRVKGDFLLTMAYDTAKTRGQVGNSIKQVIDPNRYYTVYGDATEQRYDAASRAKLYLKIERDTFYAMFGDFDTGLTVTELTRYSRTMNGLKSEYHGPVLGYQAWASRTSQTMVRDEIRGDGTSGLYRLSRRNVLANSETVTIETRDRFRSEVKLDVRRLVRHVDYDIDYLAGTLFFKQPVQSKDANLNPVWIVVEYEADDRKDQFTNFGGRVSLKPVDRLELGASFVQEGQLGKDKRMGGLDATWKLAPGTEIKAEIARSDTQAAARARAWKAEARHVGKRLQASAYARQVDGGFGLGQVTGNEDATRKLGGKADVRLNEHLNLRTEAFRQQNLATGAKRDMGEASIGLRQGRYDAHIGARIARDQDGAGRKTSSKQATAGAAARLTDRLSVRADREQTLGKGVNSVDFPTRTSIGADYRLTEATTVSATQEWTQGALQSSASTRVGVKTRPWNGAQLATSYENRLSEAGARSFANVGLKQTWRATDTLSLDLGFDRTKTFRHPGATPLNLNAPLASGTTGLGADNDFTAWSLGLNWHPDDWVWNNRLEYRTSTLEKRYNAFTGIQGRPMAWLATQFRLQWNDARQTTGARTTGMNASLAAAWRPDHDGWMFLDRLEAVLDRRRDPAAGNSTSWRYVNNFAANWQISPSFQLGFSYGAKWARESFAIGSRRAWTDALGMQAIWDVTEAWDLGMQGGWLRTVHQGQRLAPAFGLSIGHRMIDNLWVSLGYNFAGFYDRDFAASEFTRRGVFLRFRFKFDQTDLDGLLNSGQ